MNRMRWQVDFAPGFGIDPGGHSAREIGFLPVHGGMGSLSPQVWALGRQEISKAAPRDSIRLMVKLESLIVATNRLSAPGTVIAWIYRPRVRGTSGALLRVSSSFGYYPPGLWRAKILPLPLQRFFQLTTCTLYRTFNQCLIKGGPP